MENLNLTDNAISHVAKLIQVAILTGTDIVDNLRCVCIGDGGHWESIVYESGLHAGFGGHGDHPGCHGVV